MLDVRIYKHYNVYTRRENMKNGYESRIDLLEALNETTDYKLPRMFEVPDQWDEFVRRLKLLGM